MSKLTTTEAPESPRQPEPTYIPDRLGSNAARAILDAIGLSGCRVAAVRIDWNANTVEADVYVLDRAGRHVVARDGGPTIHTIEYPAWT